MGLYVPQLRDFAVTPEDHGYLAWNHDPAVSGAGVVNVTGTVYYIRVPVPKTISVTSIDCYVQTAGATLTAGQSFIGLYDSAGNRLGASATQVTAWTTTGLKSAALTSGPFTVQGGPNAFCLVAITSSGTTPPTFRGSAVLGLHLNANLSGLAMRCSTQSGTAFPVTAAPTAAVGHNQWVALK